MYKIGDIVIGLTSVSAKIVNIQNDSYTLWWSDGTVSTFPSHLINIFFKSK